MGTSEKKIKALVFLAISFILVSCGIQNRREANQIIANFEQKNVPDKREVIFDLNPYFQKGRLIIEGETSDSALKANLLNELKNLNFKDEIVVLPDSTVGRKTFGLINLSVANHRSEPSHSAELVTQSLLGTPVKILKKNNDWYLVQTPDKYISWVDAGGIHPITKNELDKWKNSERLVFSGISTEIFKTSKMVQPVSDVVMGNILELISKNRRWLEVKLPDGRTGFTPASDWINFEKLQKLSKPDSTSVVNLAIELTGRPYLWGGTSSNAMDCSGFTKTVYFLNGLILARDASLQARHGKLIEPNENLDNFQQGDLLFFGRKGNESGEEKVTHVAISLGGNEFIHASGRVKQNSFNADSANFSEYRKNSFIKARRIKGSEGNEGIIKVGEHPWY